MEKLLKTPELAALLNVQPNTIEIWRLSGKGPKFCKIGRAVRYRREDVEAYLLASVRENTYCENAKYEDEL